MVETKNLGPDNDFFEAKKKNLPFQPDRWRSWRIFGNDGDDTLIGGNDDDTINGGNGNDLIEGRDDTDILIGGNGNDTISGGNNNDILIGVDERNRITLSGFERDVLTGGPGADTFVLGDEARAYYNDFNVAFDPNDIGDDHVLITDFAHYEGDKLQIHGNPLNYVFDNHPNGGTVIAYQDPLHPGTQNIIAWISNTVDVNLGDFEVA